MTADGDRRSSLCVPIYDMPRRWPKAPSCRLATTADVGDAGAGRPAGSPRRRCIAWWSAAPRRCPAVSTARGHAERKSAWRRAARGRARGRGARDTRPWSWAEDDRPGRSHFRRRFARWPDFGAHRIRVDRRRSRRPHGAAARRTVQAWRWRTPPVRHVQRWSAMTIDPHPGRTGDRPDPTGWCDVVAEAFSPGLMWRWGMDYETLAARQLRPQQAASSLITTPGLADRPATMAGPSQQAERATRPSSATTKPACSACSASAPIASPARFSASPWLLAALDHRCRTGEEAVISTSRRWNQGILQSAELADYFAQGTITARMGNADRQMGTARRLPAAGPDGLAEPTFAGA